MKTTATITFHASHNYGSMLQAYALQRTIKEIGVKNEIINLRTQNHYDLYSRDFRLTSDAPRILRLLNRLQYYLNKKSLDKSFVQFESFLKEDLELTERQYASLDELTKAQLAYDYFISGSDQIWNVNAFDYDDAFFLPFVHGQKISYAPSIGSAFDVELDADRKRYLAENLGRYNGRISVRDEGTADFVERLTRERPVILVDPTMLLSKSEWDEKSGNNPLVKKQYIFLYRPHISGDDCRIAYQFGKNAKLPVYISLPTNPMAAFTKEGLSMKKHFDCGPWEFLNMLKNSTVNICGSFHAVVFSIVLQKPFFAINGNKDNRIKTLLQQMKLEDRIITSDNIDACVKEITEISFGDAEKILNEQRERSISFLKQSLDLV